MLRLPVERLLAKGSLAILVLETAQALLAKVGPTHVDLADLVPIVERLRPVPAARVLIVAFPLEAIAPTVVALAVPADLAKAVLPMVAVRVVLADSVKVLLAKDRDPTATLLPPPILTGPMGLVEEVSVQALDLALVQDLAAPVVQALALLPDLRERPVPCSLASKRARSAHLLARALRAASARPKSRSKPRSSTRPSRTSIK